MIFHTLTFGKKPFRSVSSTYFAFKTFFIMSCQALFVPLPGKYACWCSPIWSFIISVMNPLYRCRAIRHSTLGTPSGLSFPFFFGMYTLCVSRSVLANEIIEFTFLLILKISVSAVSKYHPVFT